MTIFQIAALLLTITAIFSYVNFRFFKLPTAIGVMLIALLASVALVGQGTSVSAANFMRRHGSSGADRFRCDADAGDAQFHALCGGAPSES